MNERPVIEYGELDLKVVKNVLIPMSDGVHRLFTEVRLPELEDFPFVV